MASTVWRGFVTFGLVSVPVRLFRAARAERVSFKRMYRAGSGSKAGASPSDTGDSDAGESEDNEDERPSRSFSSGRDGAALGKPSLVPRLSDLGSKPSAAPVPEPELIPLQQASVRKGTDEIVSEKAVVKGFEYEKNRFVAIDPEELKSIAPKTATEMEIQEFVQLSEIDPVYFETSYYISPEQAGAKAYALLYKALQQTSLVALAKIAMHNREHVVVVRSGKTGLIAHTMFFSTEVRGEDEYRADLSTVNPKELELAQTLIHSLAASFEPEKYHDAYREKIEAIIAKKVEGQPLQAESTVRPAAVVVDIAEALRKSLANLKKPVASDQQSQKAASAPASQPKKIRTAGQK